MTDDRLLAFRDELASISWPQYAIHWETGMKHIVVKPITNLRPCETPERGVFSKKSAFAVKNRAYSILSITGRSRLVIPTGAYSHLQCLVKDGSFEDFRDVIYTVMALVTQSSQEHLTVHTEGLEVGWLHVKIRPDPLE